MDWKRIRAQYAQHVADAQATRGLTQEDISIAAGLSKNAVSRILSNSRRGPTVDTFVRALRGLGVQPADFFEALQSSAADVAALAAQKGSPTDVDVVATVPLTRGEVETIALAAVAKFFISTRADLTASETVDRDRIADAATAAPQSAAGRRHPGSDAQVAEPRRNPRRSGSAGPDLDGSLDRLDSIAQRHDVTSTQLRAMHAYTKKTG